MLRPPLAWVALLGTLMLAGCQSPAAPGIEISHVHGIAFDPTQQALYLATHHGIAKGVPDGDGWQWAYVGTDRFDYMGFTQDAQDPGTFYSSGHPSNRIEFGGVHLGLRRSVDGAQTWEQRSLKGVVDFHSLSAIPGVAGGLVGIWGDQLMESRDGGLSWTNHAGPARQMADAAITTHGIIVATAQGLLAGELGNATSWQARPSPEPGRAVVAIDASPDGSLQFAGTGNGRDGGTYRSTDAGATWRRLDEPSLGGAVVAAVFAFDSTDATHIFASTAAAEVFESRDGGLAWRILRLP